MYQGANKTAITSQNMFADALLKLLQTHPYHSISISQLCSCAQVSRQTFYILFQTKENVIYYIITRNFSFLGHSISSKHETINLPQLCQYFNDYVMKNTPFLILLYKNKILSLLFANFHNCIRKYINIFAIGAHIDHDYFAIFLAGALTSIIKQYLETRETNPTLSLYTITYALLAGRAFK